MKVVFIGANAETAEIAALSIGIRWPDGIFMKAITAAQGLELVEQESPDVVLIHPDFTDMTLAKIIQGLRSFSKVPLLVLGYENNDMEMISALETGADDYVWLPCELAEIMCRIWALLRRAGMSISHGSEGLLSSGDLSINPATYEVILKENLVRLTPTEFRLLYLLMQKRNTVVSHETLKQIFVGEDVENRGMVRKYVERVRRKIGFDWIANVHGVGYRFVDPSS